MTNTYKNRFLLGFGTGYTITEKDLFEKIEFIKSTDCPIIELSLLSTNIYSKIKKLNKLKSALSNFESVSIHAPSVEFRYDNSKRSKDLLKRLNDISQVVNPTILVVHPDVIDNPLILSNLKWPVGIENMDWRKKTGRFPKELIPFFKQLPHAKMVLDLNHVFTHDPAMNLSKKLWRNFKKRIKHIHLSGYVDEKNIHVPFFMSNCDIIIKSLPTINLPMILEIGIHKISLEDMKREYQYVLSRLYSYQNKF